MSTRRILFVSHVSRMSGAERSLLDLIRGLDRTKFEPVAVVPAPGELETELARVGVRVLHVPLRRLHKTANPVRLAAAAMGVLRVSGKLAALIRREGVALVHANSDTAHLYACAAARRAAVPCVWHARDRAELGPLGPWLARRAAAIVAISANVGRHVRRYTPDAVPVYVIPNGLWPATPAPPGGGAAWRAELGIPPAAPVVGMVGQLVPWKNQRGFIDMAARLHAVRPEVRYVIVGDDRFDECPDYRAALQAYAAERGLERVVAFAGYRPDAREWMGAFAVLVHPNDREPLGRVVLEALDAGCAVVAVRACGPAEIIRDGIDGSLVDSADPAALAGAVARLLDEPDLAARLGRAARERVATAFAAADVARRIEALYDGLLAKGPG